MVQLKIFGDAVRVLVNVDGSEGVADHAKYVRQRYTDDDIRRCKEKLLIQRVGYTSPLTSSL
jgi:hypothetical protein